MCWNTLFCRGFLGYALFPPVFGGLFGAKLKKGEWIHSPFFWAIFTIKLGKKHHFWQKYGSQNGRWPYIYSAVHKLQQMLSIFYFFSFPDSKKKNIYIYIVQWSPHETSLEKFVVFIFCRVQTPNPLVIFVVFYMRLRPNKNQTCSSVPTEAPKQLCQRFWIHFGPPPWDSEMVIIFCGVLSCVVSSFELRGDAKQKGFGQKAKVAWPNPFS